MTDPAVLDGGDRRCVLLLIGLRKLVMSSPVGTVIHLIATDPAASLDLPAWCHLTGHAYLGAVGDTQRPTYAIRTIADAVAADECRPWRTPPTDP